MCVCVREKERARARVHVRDGARETEVMMISVLLLPFGDNKEKRSIHHCEGGGMKICH